VPLREASLPTDSNDEKGTGTGAPRVRLSDCTLRDARHAPGVFLSRSQCVEIARRLAALGLDEIEIGLAGGDATERGVLTAINRLGLAPRTTCVFFCLRSAQIDDALAAAADTGCSGVVVSIPTSDRFIELKLKRSVRATRKLMQRAVAAAHARGLYVAFSGEDAARADVDRLIEYARAGAEAGGDRFRFAESVSSLPPEEMRRRIGELAAALPIPVEVHCHSAYGLATANTLAAIDAGARWASATVGGIGERGGNTPLAPVLLYLHHFRGRRDLAPAGLKRLEEYVAIAAGLPFHRFTSIVGDSAFEYELGSQWAARQVYEPYPPESVGNESRLVVGRKLDRRGIAALAAAAGAELSPGELDDLTEFLRPRLVGRRRGIGRRELDQLLDAFHQRTEGSAA